MPASCSGAQVEAIADAASADPGAEGELLERAAHDGVRGLRDACARVNAAACDDESARYERVRAARSPRCWTDPDGTDRIDIRGPVDCTARVMKRLTPYERELFEQARVDGRRERSDALAFDAVVGVGGCAGGVGVAAGDRHGGADRPRRAATRCDPPG